MRRFIFVALVLASPAVLAEQIGLYPLQLPDGQPRLAARVMSEVAEHALLQVVAPSGCAPDEEVCLAAAARSAGLDAVVSADFRALKDGYYVHVRVFSASQKLIGESRGQSSADDLSGAVEKGVSEALHRAPPPAVAQAAAVPRAALPNNQMSVAEARSQTELGLFAVGLGLLTAAAGVELYSRAASSNGGGTNALVANPASNRASTFAIALAATGAGAILGGAIIFALTPDSATVQARF
jgi:hypothetical protein